MCVLSIKVPIRKKSGNLSYALRIYIYIYIYIYIWFGWVGLGFYGISTIVGYLISNPFYTDILDMISKHILSITFLNELELIFFHTVKWFQVFQSNTNNSIND